jgi:hypothetical protein
MVIRKSNPKSLDKKLLAYSVAAGAAVALGSAARADVIYYEGPWTGSGSNQTILSFNLAGEVVTGGGSAADEQFAFRNKDGTKTTGTQPVVVDALKIGARGDAAVHATKAGPKALPASTMVGPQTNAPDTNKGYLHGTRDGYPIGAWDAGERGFLGLRFDGPGDDRYYGWADITVHSTQSITMHAYAYDDSGLPIHVGDRGYIPEPSTLGLLALGATGLAAVRRRKEKVV